MTKRQTKCIQNKKLHPNNSVLTFIGETGSGDRINTARPANNNEKRSATDGFPIEVEFKEGRLNPIYWEYVKLFQKAYEVAFAPDHAAPPYYFMDDDSSKDPEEDDFLPISIGAIIDAAFFDPDTGASQIGIDLISALTAGDPVETGYKTPDPCALIGVEIRENSRMICRSLMYRMAHLFAPVRDAVVFAKPMKEIDAEFGGNSTDAAKLGREKVLDGLKFAKLVFDELLEQENKAAKAA